MHERKKSQKVYFECIEILTEAFPNLCFTADKIHVARPTRRMFFMCANAPP